MVDIIGSLPFLRGWTRMFDIQTWTFKDAKVENAQKIVFDKPGWIKYGVAGIIATPVTAAGATVRIEHNVFGKVLSFSLSELNAFGHTVPAPNTTWLSKYDIGTGLYFVHYQPTPHQEFKASTYIKVYGSDLGPVQVQYWYIVYIINDMIEFKKSLNELQSGKIPEVDS